MITYGVALQLVLTPNLDIYKFVIKCGLGTIFVTRQHIRYIFIVDKQAKKSRGKFQKVVSASAMHKHLQM